MRLACTSLDRHVFGVSIRHLFPFGLGSGVWWKDLKSHLIGCVIELWHLPGLEILLHVSDPCLCPRFCCTSTILVHLYSPLLWASCVTGHVRSMNSMDARPRVQGLCIHGKIAWLTVRLAACISLYGNSNSVLIGFEGFSYRPSSTISVCIMHSF